MSTTLSRLSGSGTVAAAAASRTSVVFGTAPLEDASAASYPGGPTVTRRRSALLFHGFTLGATATSPPEAGAVLRAYDTSGNLLGSDTVASGADTGFSMALDMAYVTRLYRSGNSWDGTLTVELEWTGAVDLTIDTATVALTSTGTDENGDLPVDSGMVGPWWAQSRVDRCPRCGRLSLREEWVRDGYVDGLLVCPACWDPEDPPERLDLPLEEEGLNEDG